MKSLIQDAIARANAESTRPVALVAPRPTPTTQANAPATYGVPSRTPAPSLDANDVDRELEEVLKGLNTKIKVVGCGGGGSNTVARLAASALENVDFVACNTDAQHLLHSRIPKKILIGRHVTKGLGAGALPAIGEQAAKETEEHIRKELEGSDLVFVTAGMGGGTGTGSAPVVAKVAKDAGALTIAVVTLPFKVEGQLRMENAEAGLARLREAADTTIVIPNDKLLEIAPRLPITAAFKVADEILVRSIRGLTEMITKPGLVNLDFADLKTIMKKGGVAMIGLGESDSDQRALDAVHEALNSPLLDVDISGATGCLVNVVGGTDMTLAEAQQCVEEIYTRVSQDCRIIWGTSVNPDLGNLVRVMLVLTGVKSKQILGREAAPPPPPGATRSAGKMGVDFVL